MESADPRKVYFDNNRLNEIAWAWSDAVQLDHQVVAFWFEADSPKELLSPKKFYAFHLAIRDDAFDAFIPLLECFRGQGRHHRKRNHSGIRLALPAHFSR